ncbi:MAG: hypothetical protein R6X02_08595 [Enhygromyxa sp.]
MTEDSRHTASIGYALGELERALQAALAHPDVEIRARARAGADRWRAVIEGMSSGTLAVGSRTPVAETPAWVTLEVVHGGFATGRYLAEGELLEHERALLEQLPKEIPGESPRERINGYYLGDAGQARLSAVVNAGRYQVEIPEEGALPVVVSLLERGCELEALELITSLRPLMHRLRFYPKLEARPRPASACVRRSTVLEVARSLYTKRPQPQVTAMNEALRVWNPLFDRLVALWLDTVENGWPCRRFPADWASRRAAWLADYESAAANHPLCSKHRHRKSNFARLHVALERCPHDSSALDGREVGSVRLALANTLRKHGAPGSEQREQLRRTQAEIAARPLHTNLAYVLAQRVYGYPHDGGLPSLDAVDIEVREGEHPEVLAGTPIPAHLLDKAARALEAPIEELIERGVISSGEVLAIVLPQITAQVVSAGIEDPVLRGLFAQIYAAFRRRRSLLLLNLEHQVQLDELPWVAALAPFRKSDLGTKAAARQTFEQVALITLVAFPQTLIPNPLIREMCALAGRAGLSLPLVEEVAADIFEGTFTSKWIEATERATTLLEGSLYARYYDLPRPGDPRLRQLGKQWGRNTADGFTRVCGERAREAGPISGRWSVAANGAVLEQSQILTTHNLAALVDGLALRPRLRELAPSLVEQVFGWIVRGQLPREHQHRARLQLVKNVAYAWRQAIFLLSLCDHNDRAALVERLAAMLAEQRGEWAVRLIPVHEGLRMVHEGGRFGSDGLDPRGGPGRRLLGWTVGRHWLLA